MSINRLVARLAVVKALTNFDEEPYPTLAGPNIFDSKIEPLENIEPRMIYPMCVVYTDYDKDHFRHGAKIHDERTLTITIELLAAQMTKNKDDEYVVKLPFADSELETTLDVFETQVFRALGGENEAAQAFRSLVSGYENTVSRRGASIEGGQRLCARQITLELKALRDPLVAAPPPYVEAFLARIEANGGDFADRAPLIRQLYSDQGIGTVWEKYAKVMGLTPTAAGMLGYEPGPTVNVPANIIWLNAQGSPLP